MGTSGARKGYKIFSINTTIRNPKRNYDFLVCFQKFDGQIMDDMNLYSYLFELVKKGIYQFNKLHESVKYKLENDIELSSQEVIDAINDNPQATGLSGRVMTQLRALKEQSFLSFEESPNNKRKFIIKITPLGKELILNPEKASIIYTKLLIGMHSNNPTRINILNQSRPFLNTLFVIDEVNKKWKGLGYEPKGILQHEFGTFVLSMKDCDYKSCAQKIIDYRLKYGLKVEKKFIIDYLKSEGILDLKFNTIVKEYPDDVFRKFEMTELIVKHGKFNHIYYNHSAYNHEKITSILEEYQNYSFNSFQTRDEYYSYQYNIFIPWEKSEIIKRKIIEAKASVLGITLNDSLTLEEQESYLDRIFYNNALAKAVDKYDIKLIIRELLILSGSIQEESKFHNISEPLRLEYLLALLIGKKYGTKGLISNIIYNEDGLPLHCAPSSKCDIIFHHERGSYILEPTMQRSRVQQLNSETSNIVRHMKEEEMKSHLVYRVMMIAPLIHADVADYFKYKSVSEEAKITTLSIEKSAKLFYESEDVSSLNVNFDEIINAFRTMELSNFVDWVNKDKFRRSLLESN